MQPVSRSSDIMSGELVFTGTRVPVQNLLDHVLAGDTITEFLEDFPSVTPAQVDAVLQIMYSLLEEKHASASG